MSGENAAHEPRTTFDWLSSDYPYALTPFQQSVINASWQTSPLGPIESWPQQLRQMTLLIIADEHPACLFWGKENTLIYNEAYTVLVGALHPALQGQDPCAAFQGELKHICQNFDDIFGIQQRTGRAALTENSLILLNRHGYEEETYFSSKYVPIIGSDGTIVGTHGTLWETTRSVNAGITLKTEIERRESMSKQSAIDVDAIKQYLVNEEQWTELMDNSPVGIAFMQENGTVEIANEVWQNLTQLSGGSSRTEWHNVIAPPSLQSTGEQWDRMTTEKLHVQFPVEMTRKFTPAHSNVEHNAHILCNLVPQVGDTGTLRTVISWVTDISDLMWGEKQLRQNMTEAITVRERLEKFIDITSHEMRNPLSAVIGCADDVSRSIHDYRKSLQKSNDKTISAKGLSLLLGSILDSISTIVKCSMHQKRISDDVLTVSKIGSNLLKISPEPANPLQVIKDTIKIFVSELKNANITIELVESESLKKLSVESLLIDPSRMIQVFMNLMTNSIKFTRTAEIRRIWVRIEASLSIPSGNENEGVAYIPQDADSMEFDQTSHAQFGDGEIVYISIIVTDTGVGLNGTEKGKLFSLFQQASAKTYGQYGGSGLGLFISRQLVQMHGGEIGVASKGKGQGCTFQFYIKGRRAPLEAENTNRSSFSFNVRSDVLQEACAMEGSAGPSAVPEFDIWGSTPPQSHIGTPIGIGIGPREASVSPFIPSGPPKPPSSSTNKGADSSKPSLGHISILVVEDNLVNQRILAKQLRAKGHTVHVANNGQEALDLLYYTMYHEDSCRLCTVAGTIEVSVVLMDLEMPIMDGLTCVKKIREKEESGEFIAHIPVIAVTANARQEMIDEYVAGGMDSVITKPYRLPQMLQEIDKIVRKFPRI